MARPSKHHRHVKHYHLARKLAVLQASGMGLSFSHEMRTLEGSMLAEQIAKLGQSGENLDMGTIIPADICMPLQQTHCRKGKAFSSVAAIDIAVGGQ